MAAISQTFGHRNVLPSQALPLRIGDVVPHGNVDGMASVPLFIVGAFFLIVGLLLMLVSFDMGLVVILMGMIPIIIGLVWGLGPTMETSGTSIPIQCPRCGQPNGAGSLFCSQCGFYLPLPA